MTPDVIKAQALELRGASLDDTRSEEIAGYVTRHVEAVLAARARLDFNDEPARFHALLAAAATAKPAKRR